MTSKVPSFPPHVAVMVHDEIGSTSDEARHQAQMGHQGNLWITAREQTNGRGRRGRAWVSKPGNLYATLLIRPRLTAADAGRLSFLAAVALHHALAPLIPAPAQVTLKWPNDVLVDGAKIAGILLESQSGPEGLVDWLSIGIGVNLAHAPQGVETTAIALADFGVQVEPMELLAPLARHMDSLLVQFSTQGFAPIHAAWLKRAAGLGKPIRVRLSDRTLEGRFQALDPDGALVLDQDGVATRIAAGEVFLTPMVEGGRHAAGN